ncbi:unnamed protein product, partial [marine sediment metagenome]
MISDKLLTKRTFAQRNFLGVYYERGHTRDEVNGIAGVPLPYPSHSHYDANYR